MASVHGRGEAQDLAPTDWSRAHEVARKIPDGWYRAQALAEIAEHAPENRVLDILGEAVQAANACQDEYGMVAVLSWPLQVAFRRGRISFAVRERDRAIALAPRIEPLPSRAFALQFLWGSCYLGGPQYAEPVWDTIVALCPPDWSWRAAALYRHIAEVREHHEPGIGAAAEVLRAMPEGKARTKLARRLGLPC
jgi:hypothetical protein